MQSKASALLELCKGKGVKIVTAESCTGGMITATLTDIAGSSAVFERGFVTYSNEAKVESLGVNPSLITQHGAVSSQVAVAMAQGALKHSKADVAVAVTGIAGPDGGTPTKPVGTVFIAVASARDGNVEECHFNGDRASVRQQSVAKALDMLEALISRTQIVMPA